MNRRSLLAGTLAFLAAPWAGLSRFWSRKRIAPLHCPLVCTFLDRLVLAGPDHIWYMRRAGDPYDFDYGYEFMVLAIETEVRSWLPEDWRCRMEIVAGQYRIFTVWFETRYFVKPGKIRISAVHFDLDDYLNGPEDVFRQLREHFEMEHGEWMKSRSNRDEFFKQIQATYDRLPRMSSDEKKKRIEDYAEATWGKTA